MQYIVSYSKPNSHYIDIELIISDVQSSTLDLQLPAWRPGRYELGNFAKNIQKWEAFNNNGDTLKFKKITKDLWRVETKFSETIRIKYNYYASEINAGSSYLDENQIYINGVNCFLYVPTRMNEPCSLKLLVPKEYRVATGLTEVTLHEFETQDYHQLVDCPLIASPTLQHCNFEQSNVKFHLWFQGTYKPEWERLEKDFKKFIKHQVDAFGEFPVDEYHFLFQILTQKVYHGVEHANSTVIALGPSYDVMSFGKWYEELLGVSSHELYHTWNIKKIRPIEMQPYDYSKENYTIMGYLAEGVTTYMGDKFLWTSGVFSWEEYAKTFNQLLEKHYNNFGVRNYSVAQSSFDTWLDGYTKGIPGRKGSIYTEGALIAFITDIFIMKMTNNQKSLNDVMQCLYQEFALNGQGVSDMDFKSTIEKVAGHPFEHIHTNLIHGNESYTEFLNESLEYIGLKIKTQPSPKYHEATLGFKVKYEGNKCIVDDIFPESLADAQGLSINDEIISINEIVINRDLSQWVRYFNKSEINLQVKKELANIEQFQVKSTSTTYYETHEIVKFPDAKQQQLVNFDEWSK